MTSKRSRQKVIAVATGGTGGHIFPAISVIKNLLDDNYKVILFVDDRFYSYVKTAELSDVLIINLKIKSFTGNFIKKIGKIIEYVRATVIAFYFLKKHAVEISIGFGSYVSLPVILATKLQSKKTLIHEQNAHIGKSNRLSALFCDLILTSFPETRGISTKFSKKVRFVGVPVRNEIKDLYYNNIHYFNNDGKSDINILITGGSQAALIFTDIIPDALEKLNKSIKKRLKIFHQVPKDKILLLESTYKEMGIKATVDSFFKDMSIKLSKMDLLIARSGASTVAEIMASGIPSILIPYPHAADNHQFANAQHLLKNGAAIVLEQKDFTADKLHNILNRLFHEKIELKNMGLSAKNLCIINADLIIKQIIDSLY